MIGNLQSSNNLQSRRLPVSSPWNQVVCGESESVATALSLPPTEDHFPSATTPVDDSCSTAESSDNGGEPNGGTAKRPVWNKPSSNCAASEVRPVIDAHSWPALSESARVTTKSEPSKGLLDGSSVPQSQVCFLCDSVFQLLRLLQFTIPKISIVRVNHFYRLLN